MSRAKFDLEAELRRNPPTRNKSALLGVDPVKSWFNRLSGMWRRGECTAAFVAETLTKGARAEGLIGSHESFDPRVIQRALKALPK